MIQSRLSRSTTDLTPFGRDFFGSKEVLTYIGSGFIGGKASGLAFAREVIADAFPDGSFQGIEVSIPRLTVIATDVFLKFMERNKLYDVPFDDLMDDRIAHTFQQAHFPAEVVGDLRGLIAAVKTPLAIRSSSLLEDAMFEPFAGVYETKMIPNNQHDLDTRFKRLIEAVKFVYSSTFFRAARDYIAVTGRTVAEEKMAVIIQEVVGLRHSDRFYPHLAGVARSHNFYPRGHARPEDGVVDLALGLGKTIVDGGLAWSYSPAYPRANPPVASARELIKRTQTEFWAVNMGKPPAYDPVRETEYLVRNTLADAEYDGTLRFAASTYIAQDDRIVSGVGVDGPRVLTFAPILVVNEIPLNDLLSILLKKCEDAVGCEVEIEFAVTLDRRRGRPARFGFLQVRPMVVSHGRVDITAEEMADSHVLAASDKVLGNGVIETIADVVYVKPDCFDAQLTPAIPGELGPINRSLIAERRPYLLVGFGRWGSSDPWLGIPVEWAQISGARVMIEATLPNMDIELSQGSHFFHNLTSFQMFYFSVHHSGAYRIDWDWLNQQPSRTETAHVRHIRLGRPLTVKVDGRSGIGVISHA